MTAIDTLRKYLIANIDKIDIVDNSIIIGKIRIRRYSPDLFGVPRIRMTKSYNDVCVLTFDGNECDIDGEKLILLHNDITAEIQRLKDTAKQTAIQSMIQWIEEVSGVY